MFDEINHVPSIVWGILGFIFAQIVFYIRMRYEHRGMLKSINSIGTKLGEFGKTQSTMGERLATIEGYILGKSALEKTRHHKSV